MTTTSTSSGGIAPPDSEAGNGKLGEAQAAASRVAEQVPQQAGRVVDDAKTQVTGAARRTMADVRSQAEERTTQAARMLGDLSGQADALAAGRPDEAGALGSAVQAVGQHAQDWSRKLETGGLDGLADDVTRFGRRHPLAFLGLAVGAGFVVGRLVRTGAAVVADAPSTSDDGPTASPVTNLGSAPTGAGVAPAAGMPTPPSSAIRP